jgi:predicted amidohydrolase
VSTATLDLAVYQFAPRFADPQANLERMRTLARESTADVLLTPELSLTGYDLGDEAAHLARPIVEQQPFDDAAADAAGVSHLAIGLCERGDDGLTYNALAIVHRGTVQFRHRKVYLPTYGMFDEGRFWARGGELRPWHLGSWCIGLLLCEDLWHPALSWLYAAAGAHLLLVAAAAGGRGAIDGGEAGGRFASADSWERIIRTMAQLHGVYVAFANRTGVEGGVTFAGGSLIAAPDGSILARANEDEETTLRVELSLEEVARARRPYAHARDEDHALVLRTLEGIVRA